MKKLFLYLPFALLFASCIQKEALNAEADIETCKILNAKGIVDPNIKGNIIIENYKIMAQAIPNIDLSALALKVTLTEGATISPDPSVPSDYSVPRNFVVTSQDGAWKKDYVVSIDTSDLATIYNFDDYSLNETGKYHVFYEKVQSEHAVFNQYIWASGNSGYALTGMGKTPEAYPTVSVHDIPGRAVKLETRSTGDFGAMAKMPIAAGNLFLGNFDVSNAMKDALKATLFGLPFGKEPISFTGSYKFKRGAAFTVVGVDGKPVSPDQARQDACDIYAVLYESAGLEKNSLNGNDVLTSEHIVAMARLENPKVYGPETDLTKVEYEQFEIAFDYASYDGKRPFSPEKSRNYEYNLAVVFTSSVDGAYFAGAVGSTLYVDNVRVICK